MEDYKNIFKKACLVQLSTSVWTCSRTLDKNLMDRIDDNSNGWLNGRKYIINPELLGPVKTQTMQARNIIKKFSYAFPITSIYLISKDNIETIDERLQHFQNRFWEKVADFEAIYDAATEEAKNILGDLYNEADYPEDITRKFNFNYRFLTINVPGKSSVLTPEIYKREKEKFEELMAETKELSMIALREEFSGLIDHLVNKLNGNTSKALSGSMFNKLNEFFEGFNNKNLFEDIQLGQLIEQAKSIIGGVSPYNLKYSDVMKHKVRTEMNSLKESIDAEIQDLPRRKIRLNVDYAVNQ